jgi:hypothetical protein
MVADSKLLIIKKKLVKQRQDLLTEAEHTLTSKISSEKGSCLRRLRRPLHASTAVNMVSVNLAVNRSA